MATHHEALGPLLSGTGSRAQLGLRIVDEEVSPCALIWVPEQVASDPELVERLRRETSAAAALDHPNIVSVFGLAEVEEGLARAVEFADGESLRRVLEVAGALPPGLAARVVFDAALGVQHAHVAGDGKGNALVHGDLRPETLLVTYAGVTKVSGYGALDVAPRELGGRRVVGRRWYCAPEQILGGRGAATVQTDVYLLGAVLYEALTGERPFAGDDDFDASVVTKPPPRLDSEEIVPELRPVVARALAKEGEARFPTVLAFRKAIDEAMGALPERAELAAFVYRAFAGDQSREARRRALERGLQEWRARRRGEAAPVPTPPPVPVLAAVPVAALGPQPALVPAIASGPAPEVATPTPTATATATASAPEKTTSIATEPPAPAPPVPETAAAPAIAMVPVGVPSPTPASVSGAAAAPVTSPAATPVTTAPTAVEIAPPPAPEAPTPSAAPSAAPSAQDGLPASGAPPPVPPPEAEGHPRPTPLDATPSTAATRRKTSWIWQGAAGAAVAALAYFAGSYQVLDMLDEHAPEVISSAPLEPSQPRHLPPSASPEPARPPAPFRDERLPGTRRDERDRGASVSPSPRASATLEVVTDPPLAVSVDGKRVGLAPCKVDVAPGRHRLVLSDSAEGIRLVRNVNARPGANRLDLTVGRGTVVVTAPPGCEVRIDGRLVGKTPLDGPAAVFEGSHRIRVSLASAHWQQDFTVADGERVTVDVHADGGAG